MATPQALTPELLAYFQKMAPGTGGLFGDMSYGGYTPIFDYQRGEGDTGPSGSGQLLNIVNTDPNDPNRHDAFDPTTGEYTHSYTANKNAKMLPLIAALAAGGMMALPSLGVGAGAGGSGIAGAGGVEALAGSGGADLLGGMSSVEPFSAQSLLSGGSFGAPEALGATNYLSGGIGSASLPASASLFGGGEVAAAALGSGSSGGGILSGLGKLLGDNKTLAGGLLGAAAGAQDKTETSSTGPWAPAEPYLKDLLGTASRMYGDRIQNPLNDRQRQQYGNLFNLVDAANTAAPSLFGTMVANASGANNYKRKGA